MRLGEKGNIYSKYGLSKNPFPTQQLPSLNSRAEIAAYAKNICTAIRTKEIHEIKEKFLDIAFGGEEQPGQATNLWIHGELGVGKSAIILYVVNLLVEHKGDQVVPIFIEAPDSGISGVYRKTVSWLGQDQLEVIASRLIDTAIRKNGKNLITSDKPDKVLKGMQKAIEEKRNPFPDLVKQGALDPKTAIKQIKAELTHGHLFVEPSVIETILGIAFEPEDEFTELRDIAAKSMLDALVTLVFLIREAGYKMTLLFIDQLEYFWNSWGKTQRVRFINDIRELVQRSIPYLSVSCTSNNDVTEDIEVNYPTFLRPLPRGPQQVVVVRKLTKEQARTLVKFYLDKVRMSKGAGELYPFTEGGVDELYDWAEGRAGQLLDQCGRLLRTSAKAGKKPIDEKVVKAYFKQSTEKPEKREQEEKEVAVESEELV